MTSKHWKGMLGALRPGRLTWVAVFGGERGLASAGQALRRIVHTFMIFAIMILSGSGGEPTRVVVAAERQQKLFISAVEVEAGKRAAKSFCASCHGLNGISANEKLPHLAGQRADYLYRQMLAYKNGARHEPSMQGAVKFLSDEALRQTAAYYASLEPPKNVGMRLASEQGKGAELVVPETDPVEAGKAAAAACTGCHGAAGNSSIPGLPSLTGQYPRYLVAAIKAYKGAGREDDAMNSMVAPLRNADIENIALYYALQKPERAATPATGDPAAAKVSAATCAGCHGEDGNSTDPATPSLAGQDAQYLAKAMRSYKDGTRDHAAMKSTVASLTGTDIDNLSAFYASQEPKAPVVRKPLTTSQWTQRCDRCHGIAGNSIDPRFPALAGQRKDYLVTALKNYRSGERTSPMMHAMSDVLSDTEIDNVAAYYARKQPKAVIFIKVPCD
ncbi:MAG: c-type cytochrome [Acidiferrobacterales bacterium]